MRLKTFAVLAVFAGGTAQAGWFSALGKAAKAGSKAGKVAKVTKLAKAGAGVTALVAAERAGLAFAHLGGDAAKAAGFVARTAEGELVLVTKAGQQATRSADTLASAVGKLGSEGGTGAHVFIDASAAGAEDALAKLPADAKLTLVDGKKQLPLKRTERGGVVDFVVDTAEGAMDLGEYLAAEEDSGSEREDDAELGQIILGAALFVGVLVYKALKARAKPT